jgi:hypothetical protein
LNEFDSYVRHTLKPLAYIRYGDDFVLFCRTKIETEQARAMGIERLNQLGLRINEAQDRTIRSWQGLHFLGHIVNENGAIISRKTRNLMFRRVDLRSISSYSSLKLSKKTKEKLPWLIDLS